MNLLHWILSMTSLFCIVGLPLIDVIHLQVLFSRHIPPFPFQCRYSLDCVTYFCISLVFLIRTWILRHDLAVSLSFSGWPPSYFNVFLARISVSASCDITNKTHWLYTFLFDYTAILLLETFLNLRTLQFWFHIPYSSSFS